VSFKDDQLTFSVVPVVGAGRYEIKHPGQLGGQDDGLA
jgi:hypothetical protein